MMTVKEYSYSMVEKLFLQIIIMNVGHAITMQSLPVKEHRLVFWAQFNLKALLSDHEFEMSAIVRF